MSALPVRTHWINPVGADLTKAPWHGLASALVHKWILLGSHCREPMRVSRWARLFAELVTQAVSMLPRMSANVSRRKERPEPNTA